MTTLQGFLQKKGNYQNLAVYRKVEVIYGIACLMVSLLMVSLLLAACSSTEEPVPAPTPEPVPEVVAETPITFSGQESEEQVVTRARGARGDGAMTRAATPLSESATSFQVWGYKDMTFEDGVYGGNQTVFPGYDVKWQTGSAATTTTNSSGWEYILLSNPEQTIKYWDWSAAAYRFFAVTGYTSHEAHEPNGPHEFSIVADVTDMAATPFFTNLWFSTGDPVLYADRQFGKPVTLVFLKPYARVRFLFKYVFPREGILLENKCFKPTADYMAAEVDKVKIATAGTFTVSYPLTGAATRESFTVTDITARLEQFREDADPDDDSKIYTETTDGWYMVLPNNTQGSFTLSVDVNKTTRTCVVPAEYMQWLPGYGYTYIFKITEEGGVEIELVESAVTPWQEMEGNRTVYNW
ncbi:MAG: hypothetical protein IJ700_08770 [Bacteroidaceae bacterium]|nr:hypothetical protein [Bacteroidaceae bacterium]MBR1683423.1 hypothetical protein [Bacteroidaceae bacterium]